MSQWTEYPIDGRLAQGNHHTEAKDDPRFTSAEFKNPILTDLWIFS